MSRAKSQIGTFRHLPVASKDHTVPKAPIQAPMITLVIGQVNSLQCFHPVTIYACGFDETPDKY